METILLNGLEFLYEVFECFFTSAIDIFNIWRKKRVRFKHNVISNLPSFKFSFKLNQNYIKCIHFKICVLNSIIWQIFIISLFSFNTTTVSFKIIYATFSISLKLINFKLLIRYVVSCRPSWFREIFYRLLCRMTDKKIRHSTCLLIIASMACCG